MRQKFIERKFKPDTVEMIKTANAIIAEYQAAGFRLTLRQLYYQFVARAVIPNRQTEYKRLGSIINDGRLAGLIDWDAIEDRTRNLESPSSWRSPEEILRTVADTYRENLWRNQGRYVEVWIEKEALVGVVEPVCERHRVPFFACRGYASQSELYAAGQRLRQIALTAGRREALILHLGDHDPSGIDMTRDNADRLALFSGLKIEVRRLALNRDQIDEYNPPPNPAKETDSRFEGYREEHGDESWELDALDPTVIDELISDAIDGVVDRSQWEEDEGDEEKNRERLGQLSEFWPGVKDYLDGL